MFHVLGPLDVHSGDLGIHISAPKQQAVLVTLLLSADRPVSVDRLTEYVWNGAPPPAARTSLQAYIYRLRQLLKPLRTVRLSSTSSSYMLQLGAEELDLHSFRTRATAARSLQRGGQLEKAAREFRDALALWRGAALDGVPGELIHQEARFLEEERLAVCEELIDLEFALGRHAAILPELTRQASEHPLRERPAAQLMLALYRSGRRAEALEVYSDVRRTLRLELGIEPGAELRRLQAAILGQGRPGATGAVAALEEHHGRGRRAAADCATPVPAAVAAAAR